MSQQISLYIDVQNRQLVRSITSTVPASLPDVFQGDTLGLYLEFLNATNDATAPYQDIDFSAAGVVVAVGTIGAPPTAGEFTITDPAATQTTASIPYNASAATVQAAIQAALTTHWSTATVTGNAGGPYTITNGSNGAQTALLGSSVNLVPVSSVAIATVQDGTSELPQIQFVEVVQNPIALQDTWTPYPAPTADVNELQAGSGTQNEIQQITLANNPYAGAFVVNFGGQTSAPIQWNATASAVQNVLQAMSSIGSGNVSVGGQAGAWVVTFTGTLALASQALMTTVAAGLIGPLALTGSLSLNTAGIEIAIGENASTTQTFAIQVTPSGGSAFTCIQDTITIYNDLIVGAPSIPTPGATYYTQGEINALFVPLADISSSALTALADTVDTAGGLATYNHVTSAISTAQSNAESYTDSAVADMVTTSDIGSTVEAWNQTLDNISANSGTVDLSGTTLTLPAGSVTVGDIDATGSPGSTTYLRGDGEWATAATGTVTSVALTVPSFLAVSGSPVTGSGTLAVTLSGTALPVANGGTGDTSLTAYAPLFGGTTGTGAVQSGTVGTSGQVLTSNGSGALPTFQAVPISTAGAVDFNVSSTITATKNTIYMVGLQTGTITLPSSVSDGSWVRIVDPYGANAQYGNTSDTGLTNFPVTIAAPGTSSLYYEPSGYATTFVCNRNYQDVWCFYQSYFGWSVVERHPPTLVGATLSSGSVTVSNSLISSSNPPTAVHNATSATNAGALFISALTSGTSVTIKSTNSSDNDTITLSIP